MSDALPPDPRWDDVIDVQGPGQITGATDGELAAAYDQQHAWARDLLAKETHGFFLVTLAAQAPARNPDGTCSAMVAFQQALVVGSYEEQYAFCEAVARIAMQQLEDLALHLEGRGATDG